MAEEKKYPTPRGEAANRAKSKYRAKAYDQISVTVPAGEKEKYQQAAAAAGVSLNAWIKEAMEEKILKKR